MNGLVDIAVCDLPKSGGKRFIAKVTSFKGSAPYLDLREWYTDAADQMRAGKGCTIRIEAIPDLHAALGAYLASHDADGA